MSEFSAGILAFTCFCQIANFSSIFSFLFGFLQVLMTFLQENICLNIYYGNILLQFGLEGVKIYKIKNCWVFFRPTFNTFAKQNNPLMKLRIILNKTVKTTTLKPENFKIICLVVFHQLRKL